MSTFAVNEVPTAAKMNQKTVFVGALAPSPTYAGQLWFDTDDSKLYKRNAANTAWVEIADAGGAPAAHKTTHQDLGSDEISVEGLAGLLADEQKWIATSQSILTAAKSTTSTTRVHLGDGATFTPTKTGKVLVLFCATGLYNDSSGGEIDVSFRYGTGTAPLAGAAETGSSPWGGSVHEIVVRVHGATGTANQGSGAIAAVISGLTLSTQYWFDGSFRQYNGVTAKIDGARLYIIVEI